MIGVDEGDIILNPPFFKGLDAMNTRNQKKFFDYVHKGGFLPDTSLQSLLGRPFNDRNAKDIISRISTVMKTNPSMIVERPKFFLLYLAVLANNVKAERENVTNTFMSVVGILKVFPIDIIDHIILIFVNLGTKEAIKIINTILGKAKFMDVFNKLLRLAADAPTEDVCKLIAPIMLNHKFKDDEISQTSQFAFYQLETNENYKKYWEQIIKALTAMEPNLKAKINASKTSSLASSDKRSPQIRKLLIELSETPRKLKENFLITNLSVLRKVETPEPTLFFDSLRVMTYTESETTQARILSIIQAMNSKANPEKMLEFYQSTHEAKWAKMEITEMCYQDFYRNQAEVLQAKGIKLPKTISLLSDPQSKKRIVLLFEILNAWDTAYVAVRETYNIIEEKGARVFEQIFECYEQTDYKRRRFLVAGLKILLNECPLDIKGLPEFMKKLEDTSMDPTKMDQIKSEIDDFARLAAAIRDGPMRRPRSNSTRETPLDNTVKLAARSYGTGIPAFVESKKERRKSSAGIPTVPSKGRLSSQSSGLSELDLESVAPAIPTPSPRHGKSAFGSRSGSPTSEANSVAVAVRRKAKSARASRSGSPVSSIGLTNAHRRSSKAEIDDPMESAEAMALHQLMQLTSKKSMLRPRAKSTASSRSNSPNNSVLDLGLKKDKDKDKEKGGVKLKLVTDGGSVGGSARRFDANRPSAIQSGSASPEISPQTSPMHSRKGSIVWDD